MIEAISSAPRIELVPFLARVATQPMVTINMRWTTRETSQLKLAQRRAPRSESSFDPESRALEASEGAATWRETGAGAVANAELGGEAGGAGVLAASGLAADDLGAGAEGGGAEDDGDTAAEIGMTSTIGLEEWGKARPPNPILGRSAKGVNVAVSVIGIAGVGVSALVAAFAHS